MKPSPNVPTAKPLIATAFRPAGQALPAPEGFLLVGRQRLAAALLAQSTAGAQAEVQVVEDLRGVVGHGFH